MTGHTHQRSPIVRIGQLCVKNEPEFRIIFNLLLTHFNSSVDEKRYASVIQIQNEKHELVFIPRSQDRTRKDIEKSPFVICFFRQFVAHTSKPPSLPHVLCHGKKRRRKFEQFWNCRTSWCFRAVIKSQGSGMFSNVLLQSILAW